MPRLALALCVLWFIALFVVRSVAQWRTTGSTGFKGFHGRVGSWPWIAGVATSLGFVLTPLAPVAALLEWPGGALAETNPLVHAFGALALAGGIAGALAAQFAMGDAWRVGVDTQEQTALVTNGLFAWVRNPIFSFMGLSALGLGMLVPSSFTGVGVALAAIGIEMQVRWVEEPHLAHAHGSAYAQYASRVGRFFPGLGRIRPVGGDAPADMARG